MSTSMPTSNPTSTTPRRFDAGRWVHRACITQTVALSAWAVATFVLGCLHGEPQAALVPALLALVCGRLAAAWGRLATGSWGSLVAFELYELLVCLVGVWSAGLHPVPVLGAALAAAVLVLLTQPASRAWAG